MKEKAPVKGQGSNWNNAKTINTERTPKKDVGCGLPHTYYGNSRSIDTERKKK